MPETLEDGFARFGGRRGFPAPPPLPRLEIRPRREAVLEEFGVAQILAGGEHAAFEEDGVDVRAARAAEWLTIRNRVRKACRSCARARMARRLKPGMAEARHG